MKKVLLISSAKGNFEQYLLISEAKLIPKICENIGEIKVLIVPMTKARYKIEFNK